MVGQFCIFYLLQDACGTRLSMLRHKKYITFSTVISPAMFDSIVETPSLRKQLAQALRLRGNLAAGALENEK